MAQICGVFRSPSQFLSLDNLGNTYSLKWDLNNSKHKNRNACLAEIGFAFQFCITRPDASGSLCLLSVKKRLCGWFLGMPFFLFPSATWLNVCFHFSGNAWVDVSRQTQPIALKKKKKSMALPIESNPGANSVLYLSFFYSFTIIMLLTCIFQIILFGTNPWTTLWAGY